MTDTHVLPPELVRELAALHKRRAGRSEEELRYRRSQAYARQRDMSLRRAKNGNGYDVIYWHHTRTTVKTFKTLFDAEMALMEPAKWPKGWRGFQS